MTHVSNESHSEDNSETPNRMEMVYHSLSNEIIDEILLSLCFKVHRAIKYNYFPVDEFNIVENKFEKCESHGQDFHDEILREEGILQESAARNKQIQVVCPHCSHKTGHPRFVAHVAKCMGNPRIHSSNKRIIEAFDNSFLRTRPRTKKTRKQSYSDTEKPKKPQKPKSKPSPRLPSSVERKLHILRLPKHLPVLGEPSSSSSDGNLQFQTEPYELNEDILSQKCGAIVKRTGKMCMNTLNCSQHHDDQKMDLKRSSIMDPFADDVQIDVDTVDEISESMSFVSRSPSFQDSSTSSTSSTSIKQESGINPHF